MSSIVNVFVVSPDTRSERRFDLHITVEQLKTKLELITGIPVQNQRISVQNDEGETTAHLSDDTKQLGFYGLTALQTLNVRSIVVFVIPLNAIDVSMPQVIDTNPATSFTGQLSDVSQVEKFELSDDAYAKRTGRTTSRSCCAPLMSVYSSPDSVLAFKQRNKVGRFASPSETIPAPVVHVDIPIGARCEVESAEEGLHKRGTVRFVGQTTFAMAGVWVGIEYDEPIGRNDGSVQGERYFTCRPNHGVFVRPDKVRVGDFPVEEINFDDEEM
ncbi:CAP Gly-rich domain-containing protein [Lanmaoa asiatica]|nr:CAP Gly-rich domain-containing protein [Lanmaoa asiatica]